MATFKMLRNRTRLLNCNRTLSRGYCQPKTDAQVERLKHWDYKFEDDNVNRVLDNWRVRVGSVQDPIVKECLEDLVESMKRIDYNRRVEEHDIRKDTLLSLFIASLGYIIAAISYR